jgi:hypothetical protein
LEDYHCLYKQASNVIVFWHVKNLKRTSLSRVIFEITTLNVFLALVAEQGPADNTGGLDVAVHTT